MSVTQCSSIINATSAIDLASKLTNFNPCPGTVPSFNSKGYSDSEITIPSKAGSSNLVALGYLHVTGSSSMTTIDGSYGGALGIDATLKKPTGDGLSLYQLDNLKAWNSSMRDGTILSVGVASTPLLQSLDLRPYDASDPTTKAIGIENINCPKCQIHLEETGLKKFDMTMPRSLGQIELLNNPNLTNFTVRSTQIIVNALTVSTTEAMVDFPNMVNMNNASFLGMQYLMLPNLLSVNISLGVTVNSDMQQVDLTSLTTVGKNFIMQVGASATTFSMPNLTTVGNDFKVIDSGSLVGVSAQNLVSVGGNFEVSGASLQLFGSKNFQSLQKVAGDFQMNGNITSISFPGLKHVGGDFKISSTNANLDCGPIKQLASTGAITTDYSCLAPGQDLQSSDGQAATSTITAPTKSSSSSAAVIGGVVAGVGVALIIALILFFVGRRKGWFGSKKAAGNEPPGYPSELEQPMQRLAEVEAPHNGSRSPYGHEPPKYPQDIKLADYKAQVYEPQELAAANETAMFELDGGEHGIAELPPNDADATTAASREDAALHEQPPTRPNESSEELSYKR